jgi:hypothetical protein
MNKYQHSKIYKIMDSNGEMVYIGSTTNPLCVRFSNHKCSYKSRANNNTVYIIFDKYGIENCNIHLIEEYPCNSKQELERREGQIIKSFKCVNKYIAGRTQKEYYIDNKARHQELMRLWYIRQRDILKEKYQQNKTVILAKQKERRQLKKNNNNNTTTINIIYTNPIDDVIKASLDIIDNTPC